jgi:hypothetical protein
MYMEREKIHTDPQMLLPGSFDDESLVRGIITDAIKNSPKSRELVAEEMSALLGRTVTLRMLNAFTAEANEKHRWPFAWSRAFCQAIGDWRLITALVERSGFKIVKDEELHLLELGKQYLTRKLADEKISELERTLKVRA